MRDRSLVAEVRDGFWHLQNETLPESPASTQFLSSLLVVTVDGSKSLEYKPKSNRAQSHSILSNLPVFHIKTERQTSGIIVFIG